MTSNSNIHKLFSIMLEKDEMTENQEIGQPAAQPTTPVIVSAILLERAVMEGCIRAVEARSCPAAGTVGDVLVKHAVDEGGARTRVT